ncbi:MAG: methylated-DNA--[protein]-cysteine S-methyltransferase [Pseudorhodoplanes sp.]|nr:methylated-DNA--[protein]-cysteine S-methyltransferase [Pseudorhodoplanes sp.]
MGRRTRPTLSLVVPCHRVIGADSTLTGYGGGLHIKRRLLEHEAGTKMGMGDGVMGVMGDGVMG